MVGAFLSKTLVVILQFTQKAFPPQMFFSFSKYFARSGYYPKQIIKRSIYRQSTWKNEQVVN